MTHSKTLFLGKIYSKNGGQNSSPNLGKFYQSKTLAGFRDFQIRNLRVAGRPRNKYRGHKLPNYLQRKQVDLPNYYRFGLDIFILKVRGLEFIVNILRPTVLLNYDLPFVQFISIRVEEVRSSWARPERIRCRIGL